MKILLCRPPDPRLSIIIPNLGLGYLSASLKRGGHEVRVLDCVREGMDLAGFRSFLDTATYALIGVQALSCDWPAAKAMCAAAKQSNKNVVTLAGGPHISGLPELSLAECADIDYALVGEAESSILSLADHLSGKRPAADVPGLVHRAGGVIKVNPPGKPENLDELGPPDWTAIDPRTYPPSPHGMFTRFLPTAPIITSRGCPYECTYCNARYHSGRTLRKRSPEGIIEEIRLLRERFGVREIHIEDDNFTFDRARAVRFCEMLISERLDVAWACPNGVRLDRLDRGLLQLMEKSGCYSFALGIESGSPRVLEEMKRHITLETIREKVRLIASCTGIHMTGFFILGYPTETVEDVEMTIRLACGLPLHRAQFSNFVPLPGTEIFTRLVDSGDIDPRTLDWEKLRDNYIGYTPPHLTADQIRRLMRRGLLAFYLRPRILLGLLREIHSPRQLIFAVTRFLSALR